MDELVKNVDAPTYEVMVEDGIVDVPTLQVKVQLGNTDYLKG
jgi:hypothetical protein